VASVALLMLSASGVYAQRRGAFVPGPPYAGRPVVPAVTGTPGAAPWNPGAAGMPFRGHSHDHNGSPQILAVPVPVIAEPEEPDPQPAEIVPPPPEAAPPPPLPPRPATTSFVAAPAPAGVSQNRCVQPDPPEPPHVLIALNNGWVYAAIAYWVDGGTLHYVTPRGEHNQVSLELVNRKLSTRLNKPAQIEFMLP
jgi:hypothetical protein